MYGLYHRLARELGLQLLPPDPGAMTFSLDLVGDLDGHPVNLRRLCGSGARVDITSPIRPHLDLGFGLSRAGFRSRVSEWLGKQDIQLGDPEFDKAFTIRADEPDRVRALLTPELRNVIAGIRVADFELTDAEYSTGHRVNMGGYESFEEIASELREAVVVARAVGNAHAGVPAAEVLRAHHDAWIAYARTHELQFAATPLWMQGKLGKNWVLARASRNRSEDFSLELLARLEQPLPVVLNIQPQRGFIESVGQKSVPIGDAEFDRVFDVTRTDRIEVVDQELRQRLLALAQLGSVTLDRSEVRVTLPALLDSARVPLLLEDLDAVLSVLKRNAHGPDEPYR